jgi:hypothetical protein
MGRKTRLRSQGIPDADGLYLKSIPTKDLKPHGFFTKMVYLDRGFVLLAPETPLTQDLVNRLSKWEFRSVWTDGECVDSIAPEGKSGEAKEGLVIAEGAGDKEKLEVIRAFLVEYIAFIEGVYSRFVTNSELKYAEIAEKMRQICEVLNSNRKFVLRSLSLIEPHKNYLIAHAVNSSILSILLGVTLKMPIARLMELGAAAVLHEIGMVKLPPNLFMANRQLSVEERRRITAHTVLGYNILKGGRQTASAGAGLTYQYREAEGVEQGGTFLGEFFQDYAFKFNGRLSFLQSLNALYSPDGRAHLASSGAVPVLIDTHAEDYKVRFNSTLQGRFSERISLNLRYEYEYDNAILDKNGRTDRRVTSSVGYSF